jgi:vitamin B12/bleomycin/antimicrobial peptide transport system ATP-binding/permease protein
MSIHFEQITKRYSAGPVVNDVSLQIEPGEFFVLLGPSGSGKSTLLRAIAGIWPFGGGVIEAPPRASMLFLPQKPYLPIGSLRRALCYPAPAESFDTAAIQDALAACDLRDLESRLDEVADWSLRLSPGEQQRIALARAWLLRPACVFLDEATSALDEATQARIFPRLRERLAGATLVSVAHRPGLAAWHDRCVELRAPAREGASGAAAPASLVEALVATPVATH